MTVSLFRFFTTLSVVCFPQFVFPRTLCFGFLLFYHPSHPPRFLALLVIRFHRCFRDLLFALLSVGPALLLSSFSFVSLLFLPALFYPESHRLSLVWLASFSFPPCFSFILVFLSMDHLWLPLHYPQFFLSRSLPNVCRYISAFLPFHLLSLLFRHFVCSFSSSDSFITLRLFGCDLFFQHQLNLCFHIERPCSSSAEEGVFGNGYRLKTISIEQHGSLTSSPITRMPGGSTFPASYSASWRLILPHRPVPIVLLAWLATSLVQQALRDSAPWRERRGGRGGRDSSDAACRWYRGWGQDGERERE